MILIRGLLHTPNYNRITTGYKGQCPRNPVILLVKSDEEVKGLESKRGSEGRVDALRELRRRKGLSQKDLAVASGVGQDTISGIESGRHEPRPSTLRKLADTLGVEVADFFGETEVPKVLAP